MNANTDFRTCPGAPPRRSPRRGFTLIELLIVIAILLAIGGLVVVNLLPAKDQADIDLTRVQIDQFEEALEHFKLDLNRYPTEDEGLRALWTKDAIEDETEAERWRRQYLKEPTPRDRWDHEWIYHNPAQLLEGAAYDIISMGPDGEEGTEDDIHNHMHMMNKEGEIDEGFDDFTPEGGTGG